MTRSENGILSYVAPVHDLSVARERRTVIERSEADERLAELRRLLVQSSDVLGDMRHSAWMRHWAWEDDDEFEWHRLDGKQSGVDMAIEILDEITNG